MYDQGRTQIAGFVKMWKDWRMLCKLNFDTLHSELPWGHGLIFRSDKTISNENLELQMEWQSKIFDFWIELCPISPLQNKVYTLLFQLKVAICENSKSISSEGKVCHEKNRTDSLSYCRFSFYLINTEWNSVKHWHQ